MTAPAARSWAVAPVLALVLALGPSCGMLSWTAADSMELGNYDQALAVANANVESGSKVFAHRLLAIESLGKIARAAGEVKTNDGETRAHYEAARSLAGADQAMQAELDLALASYYELTFRSRSALPHLEEALADARSSQRPDLEISALHGLARVFADIGEVELKRDYQGQAIATAEAQFPDGALTPGPILDAYLEVLDWDIRDALLDRDPRARIVSSWRRLDEGLEAIFPLKTRLKALPVFGPITLSNRQTDLSRRTRHALNGAVAFAKIGDRETARLIFDRTAAELVDIGGKTAIRRLRNRMLCARAQLAYEFQSYRRASRLVDQCIDSAASPADREAIERRSTSLLALIKEASGDLEAADELYRQDIKRFEAIRTAIPVVERSVFFRGGGRVPWEGLIRVRAARYIDDPSLERLRALLEASDGMRARQLKELKGEDRAYAPDLETIRDRIGEDGALVVYSAVGDAMVGIGISRAGAQVERLELDPVQVNARLAGLVADIERNGPGFDEASPQLEMLGRDLLEPFGPVLAGKSRLTIIGEGAMGAFPMELLRLDGRPIGSSLAVATAPSLAFFETSRPREVSDALYALADPTYKAAPQAGGDLASFADNSRGSAYLGQFAALPETRSEVEALAELFDGRTTIGMGVEASESHLAAHPPKGHAYVHFATHGLLAGQIPGLAEPALVLAHEPERDGLLTASEVASLDLDADLTVLSACSTGAGESLPGEGVLGMGRAFLVAGSRGVLVSLWPVDSAATEALMVLFYRYHRAGLDAPRALQLAKRELRTQPQWDHPYFYAAFILVAEGGLLEAKGDPVAVSDTVRPQWSETQGGESRGLSYSALAPPVGTFDDDYSIQPAFN